MWHHTTSLGFKGVNLDELPDPGPPSLHSIRFYLCNKSVPFTGCWQLNMDHRSGDQDNHWALGNTEYPSEYVHMVLLFLRMVYFEFLLNLCDLSPYILHGYFTGDRAIIRWSNHEGYEQTQLFSPFIPFLHFLCHWNIIYLLHITFQLNTVTCHCTRTWVWWHM